MRVLVAMSGGVDSSVAAGLLVEAGYDVEGATLKLWGGPSDSGCCSVGDVEDARRVAEQLGIVHHVFNLAEEFDRAVVTPYVDAHARGQTPNPCIECNRHIKFDVLLARSRRLGFATVATGHHARVDVRPDGSHRLRRGADDAKDQSYVLSMLGQDQLARIMLPIGDLEKSEVRAHARRLGMATASKPDSQDVCFIHGDVGRAGFLGERLEFHGAELVDARSGEPAGQVDAVELVTVGQRRGMGHGADGARRYVVSVDVPGRRVRVGGLDDAMVEEVGLAPGTMTWVDRPVSSATPVIAQVSAHGRAIPSVYLSDGDAPRVVFATRQRPVAPGQTVALYSTDEPEAVLGAGIAA